MKPPRFRTPVPSAVAYRRYREGSGGSLRYSAIPALEWLQRRLWLPHGMVQSFIRERARATKCLVDSFALPASYS